MPSLTKASLLIPNERSAQHGRTQRSTIAALTCMTFQNEMINRQAAIHSGHRSWLL